MDNSIQIQINELHQKMDVLLDYVNKQRLNSEVVEDLITDVSIIGKDVYDSTVEELENRAIEIQPAELTELGISFLRNIQNFNMMIGTFESMVDLSKEVGPIANEIIIDFQKKLGEIVLLAGSDICVHHETWMEIIATSWGGYHREASNTTIAPYVGAGIGVDFQTLELDFDIRLHFPDLTDRWLSAGCSIMFF